jgi:ankyrin repeat protein
MLGFRGLAEHLIAKHPEHVNAEGGDYETSMQIAAIAGHADILSLLLEHGADVDDGKAWIPLHRASWKGNLEAGQCLLDHGADINARNRLGQTPLFLAVYYGHVEFARMLLVNKGGASINDLDDNFRWTPLHVAVDKRNIQAVRLLLEHGADVNVRNRSGETPSQLGLKYGRHEIVELLSEHSAESVK